MQIRRWWKNPTGSHHNPFDAKLRDHLLSHQAESGLDDMFDLKAPYAREFTAFYSQMEMTEEAMAQKETTGGIRGMRPNQPMERTPSCCALQRRSSAR